MTVIDDGQTLASAHPATAWSRWPGGTAGSPIIDPGFWSRRYYAPCCVRISSVDTSSVDLYQRRPNSNSPGKPRQSLPSKHRTFVQQLYNVRPTSKKFGRLCTNFIEMFCVCWICCSSRCPYGWPAVKMLPQHSESVGDVTGALLFTHFFKWITKWWFSTH